ncbi:hypothetical protein FISHEDRAFT_51638 [Fistulina hepatica ATCC 64428]|uniref:Calcium-channel protein CCH1 n=1 Tax=Fistulina hepatica ATCC 64428 TaxID=1128425 RepID=A0A0D7A3D0_9AGAR|nr:hypothetical protein FISHEDRAFT_51638 [Fistulina hepatica ATCC 64428]
MNDIPDDIAGPRNDGDRTSTYSAERIWTSPHPDAEQTLGTSTTTSTRRRTVRYDVSPSPLKRTSAAFKHVSRSLRRASLRVVNLAAPGMSGHTRLQGNDGGDDGQGATDDDADDDMYPQPLHRSVPLRGRTLGFLTDKSRVRIALYHVLIHPWTEPCILLFIIANAVALVIQASRDATLSSTAADPHPAAVKGYFHHWEDYMLFVLFVVFTVEAFARMAVSGLLLDPDMPISALFRSPFSATHLSGHLYGSAAPQTNAHSAVTSADSLSRQPTLAAQPVGPLARGLSVTQRIACLNDNIKRPFTLSESSAQDKVTIAPPGTSATVVHTFPPSGSGTGVNSEPSVKSTPMSLPFRLMIDQSHSKTARNVPYLRRSWNRVDIIAITTFWITFALAMFGIIGVQSFKGSLRRSCFLQPTDGGSELELDGTFCGGFIDPTYYNISGYITVDGQMESSKGFICPLGQVCRETSSNPYDNIEGFDTIYMAILQVIIVASTNGWSPLMYAMIDSEYFVSCLYFIICVIVLNFWLINLFVAVITNSFSGIRKQTKHSAFGASEARIQIKSGEDESAWVGNKQDAESNIYRKVYVHTRWLWVLLALFELSLQASGTTTSNETYIGGTTLQSKVTITQQDLMYYGELAITIAFDCEIILRFLACLPDWRGFFRRSRSSRRPGQNMLDLFLAIACSIIQIPVLRQSKMYNWFTIFQLARFYRVIIVVPRMRPLLVAVFGNVYGLANMTLFLFLVNFLSAVVAVQFLRGDLTDDNTMNFGQIYNAFLAMYQIFSSENWTNVLYSTGEAELDLGQTVITLIFISMWLLFANFIILQMFIAVLNENFEIAEESKRGQQATNFLASQRPGEVQSAWLRKLNPYRWVRANPVKVKVDNLPSNLVLPMQKSLVQDYTRSTSPLGFSRTQSNLSDSGIGLSRMKTMHHPSRSLSALQRLFTDDEKTVEVPLANIKHTRSGTLASLDNHDDETERHLELLASIQPEISAPEDFVDALYERRAQKADFIRDHPTYDKTFWIFSQKDWLRRMCQKVVRPANGDRLFGTPPSAIAHPIFQLLLLLVVTAGIVVEAIATPLYRREYYAEYGYIRWSWFDVSEASFGMVLLLEFAIKVLADGFIFTPNAYVRSLWNILDALILAGVLVNVATGLIFIGGLSRLTRSLKALRALRLITLIGMMRNTFRNLIISGAWRIVDAGVLAILYMIPYAVWGLNIFADKMNECNDDSVSGMSVCVDEYTTNVWGNSFDYPVPRAWDNPAPSTVFSFDTFRASLLILFEIVSLEGWVDVMSVAMSIVGVGEQPEINNSQYNSIFFVIYNLLGAVVILTLFVSIIIGNFQSRTGSAFLTQPQQEWIDLQKLIKRQRPSKRPKKPPVARFRRWCFDRAVQKHGWWSRAMTFLYIVHIMALMTQTYTTQNVADTLRSHFFSAVAFIYVIDVLVRFYGLGWRSFQANGWNLFDVVAASGSFITTLIVRFGDSGYLTQQLQKLFLVSIAFKLVQRTNSLNKLFKTSVSSLPVILSLLGLWFILFLFFAILYVEVFSLTKWYSAEAPNINYATIGNALVMLAFMTTGEGWNQYMHDYALIYPRCTNQSGSDALSDCGSVGWAYFLFIAWNVLSMYIFVNLFTGVVVENFSYVFQTTTGGAKSVTREQMRAFKKAWAEYANVKTGSLEKQNFVKFFAKLGGVFEVRIYPVEFSMPNIRKAVAATPDSQWSGSRVIEGIDMDKLDQVLGSIDYQAIRRRRNLYSRVYHEALIVHKPGRGISFTDMLILLAHHKLIVDREALVVQDLVVRTEQNKLVTDLVNLDRVRSLLKTVSHRRRFLAHRQQMLAARSSQQGIPSIVVDTLPSTPPVSSRDISSAGYENSPGSPSPSDYRFSIPDVSLALDRSPGLHRSSRSPRRASDTSFLSGDLGYTRESSLLDDDPQVVLSSMQNSMWEGKLRALFKLR